MRRVHLLHTNDIHSHFVNLPRLATVINERKKEVMEAGEEYLLLDLGDHLDRVHPITEASLGRANLELLEKMGYHYLTLGNNEGITMPKEKLQELYTHTSCKVVLSNLLDKESLQAPNWVERYSITELSGIRIGFLGVTAPFTIFYEQLGWYILDPVETVKRMVAELRPRVDLLVLMSHCGIQFDEQIVVEVPQIDLVLGAHTHNYFPDGHWVNEHLIAEAGKFGQALGHVVIEWDDLTQRIVSLEATCEPVDEYEGNKEIQAWIEQKESLAHQALGEAIVQLNDELTFSWYEESPLPNLLAIAVRKWTNSEMAMLNSGLILRSLPQGPITREMIHQTLPHPINPAVVRLSGREIGQVLRHSLDERIIQQRIHGYGFRGTMFGSMVVDGLTVNYHGNEITSVLYQGKPLQADQLYRVGIIDMYTFGVGFPELVGVERAEYFLPEMLRDLLSQELQNPMSIIDAKRNRWIRLS